MDSAWDEKNNIPTLHHIKLQKTDNFPAGKLTNATTDQSNECVRVVFLFICILSYCISIEASVDSFWGHYQIFKRIGWNLGWSLRNSNSLTKEDWFTWILNLFKCYNYYNYLQLFVISFEARINSIVLTCTNLFNHCSRDFHKLITQHIRSIWGFLISLIFLYLTICSQWT